MNFLKRALTSYLSHSPRPGRRCLAVLRPVAAQSAPYSSSVQKLDRNYEPSRKPSSLARTVKKQVEGITDWPRPSEIPYQAKVTNSVNLVGHINAPVKIQSGAGKALAGAVLSQDITGKLVIPVVFEGDLAHVVSLHVKANDTVHVVGRLSEDPHPFVLGGHQGSLHLVVEDIKFVQGFVNSSSVKKFPKKIISEPEDDEFSIISMKRQEPEVAETKLYQTSLKSGGVAGSDQWEDLLKNPDQWLDYREKKANGLVKEKHPDFKHKEYKTALWLNSAPKSVLQGLGKVNDDAQELENVKDDAQKSPVGNSKQGGGKSQGNGKFVNRDESWKNLVEDPSKWWDNRVGKKNAKSPDFKHKETGEALWMSSAPSWVEPKLPPLKEKKVAAW